MRCFGWMIVLISLSLIFKPRLGWASSMPRGRWLSSTGWGLPTTRRRLSVRGGWSTMMMVLQSISSFKVCGDLVVYFVILVGVEPVLEACKRLIVSFTSRGSLSCCGCSRRRRAGGNSARQWRIRVVLVMLMGVIRSRRRRPVIRQGSDFRGRTVSSSIRRHRSWTTMNGSWRKANTRVWSTVIRISNTIWSRCLSYRRRLR